MIIDSKRDSAWQTVAACRGMDPAIFFSPDDDASGVARAVCSICPVQAECLAEAFARQETYGVWGGTRERDRREAARTHAGPRRTVARRGRAHV